MLTSPDDLCCPKGDVEAPFSKAQDLGTLLPALCRQMGLETVQELPFCRVVTEQQWLLLELGTYTSVSPCKHSQDKKAVPGCMQGQQPGVPATPVFTPALCLICQWTFSLHPKSALSLRLQLTLEFIFLQLQLLSPYGKLKFVSQQRLESSCWDTLFQFKFFPFLWWWWWLTSLKKSGGCASPSIKKVIKRCQIWVQVR